MMQTQIKHYYKQIGGGLVVRHMQPSDADKLETLQRIVFPTLGEDELILAAHYLRHLEVFPEGQFVIADNDNIMISIITITPLKKPLLVAGSPITIPMGDGCMDLMLAFIPITVVKV
jgi:hypothetical protein